MNKKLDLLHFPKEREESLKAIKRYDIFDTMFYRTDLWIHSNRVSWIVRELMPIAKKFYKNIDAKKAIIMAQVHDDAEIYTGDYNATHKASGSKSFLLKIKKQEIEAIKKLSNTFPKYIGKYSYKKLLFQIMKKGGIETKVVCYADRLDAFCESLHEVLAGNIAFLPAVIFDADRLSRFEQKYPELKLFLNYSDSPLTNLKVIFPQLVKVKSFNDNFNKLFTKKSIKIPTVFYAYDEWRAITIKNLGNNGLQALTKQKEF